MHRGSVRRPHSRFNIWTDLIASVAFAAISALTLLTFSGCGLSGFQSSNNVAETINNTVGCTGFQEKLWDAFIEAIEKDGHLPTASDIEYSIHLAIKKGGRLSKLSTDQQNQVIAEAQELTALIGEYTHAELSASSASPASLLDFRRGSWIARIVELEIGDRTTVKKSQDVDKAMAKMRRLEELAKAGGLASNDQSACPQPTPPSPAPGDLPSPLLNQWKKTRTPGVFGALLTMAVGYQSCDAGQRIPLNRGDKNLNGITVTGPHPSGEGQMRKITNVKELIKDHPYLDPYLRPAPSCFDVIKTPPIYDYGGKPAFTAANTQFLNLFANAGTGSDELGIDCSAFVFTSYSVAGLKLKKEVRLKASLVAGVSSSMLMNPKRNGLTCLDFAQYSSSASLLPGDIVAIDGHAVIVESVGADPFAINSISSAKDCRRENIHPEKFEFSIIQSSPSKGGIGLNRITAKDYLPNEPTMKSGLIDHAVAACLAHFKKTPTTSPEASASVVRHLGTSDCLDVPLKLTHEDCLNSCSAPAPASL